MTEKRCIIEFTCDVMTLTDTGEPARFRIGEIVELDYEFVARLGLIGFGQAIRRHDLEQEKTEEIIPAPKAAPTPPTIAETPAEPENESVVIDTPSEPQTNRIKTKWLTLRQACEKLGLTYNEAARNKLKNAILSNQLRGAVREGPRPTYQVDASGIASYKRLLSKERRGG